MVSGETFLAGTSWGGFFVWERRVSLIDSTFGYWLMVVIVLDSLSLLIDTIDVLRYVKGERTPFLTLPA